MSQGTRRLLLVDDRQALMSLDVPPAVRARCEMLTATTAAEAMDLIAAHEPQMVVVERDLPDADGYRLIESLRAEHPELRILLATRTGEAAERRAAERVGADGIVIKPIDPSALADTFQAMLSRPRRAQPRVAADIDIDYSAGDEAFLSKAVNLSAGGMFISTANPLEVNAPVRLRFRVPGVDRLIEISGRVAWRTTKGTNGLADEMPGMGIAFDSVSEQDAADLQTFVARKLDELGIPET